MIADTLVRWASGVRRSVSAPRNASILESTSISLSDPAAWESMYGGTETDAGIRVSHQTALMLAPVWQGVSIISGDAAGVRQHVYLTEPDGDEVIDKAHPAEFLVSIRANELTSAFEFWRRLMAHALLWGNGYAYIRRTGRMGEPVELLNLLPDRTKLLYDDEGTAFYVTEVRGELEPLFPWEVLHVKGLSIECGMGCDLVLKARNAWALALAAEKFASKFFKHGAHAGGILEIPVGFTKKAADGLEEGFRKRLGEDQWFRTVILRDGAKFHSVTIDAQKAQMSELREDQVREVARFFNLPPRKLGITDSQSYNSSEQDQLQYLTGCLWHWFCAIDGECNLKLLSESDLRTQKRRFGHDVSDLVRPDATTLNRILNIQRTAGVINANEWRREIGRSRRDDPGGDSYGNPNTTPGKSSKEEPAKESAKDSPEDGDEQDLRDLFGWAAGKLARRMAHDAEVASRSTVKFCKFADDQGAIYAVTDEALRQPACVIARIQGRNHFDVWKDLSQHIVEMFCDRLNAIASTATADTLPAAIELLRTDLVSAPQQWEAYLFGDSPDAQAKD